MTEKLCSVVELFIHKRPVEQTSSSLFDSVLWHYNDRLNAASNGDPRLGQPAVNARLWSILRNVAYSVSISLALSVHIIIISLTFMEFAQT